MTDAYAFRPRKKRIGAYFNDGHVIYYCQAEKDGTRGDDDRLVRAVREARKAFAVVFYEKDPSEDAKGGKA